MRERIHGRLTYSNVLVTILAVVVLGNGIADAAGHLGKNTVGTKQLKKNAVTTAKIKKNAVVTAKLKNKAITAAKVKNGTLTGTQINASTLGTVPTAQRANTLAAPEDWHEVGASGQPAFQEGWHNTPQGGPLSSETVAFYRDQEGVVHLRGVAKGGVEGTIFQLPPGYRPGTSKIQTFVAPCSGSVCSSGVGVVGIDGPGFLPVYDGAVSSPFGELETVSLDGIAFRAES